MSNNGEQVVDKEQEQQKPSPIVQYIAVRSDLKWPKGAMVAQGCHASVAAIHLFYNDPDTTEYLKNLDSMHKVVVNVPSEKELVDLSNSLGSNGIKFKLWTEQPENIPSCLATKPYAKNVIENFFKMFKLLR